MWYFYVGHMQTGVFSDFYLDRRESMINVLKFSNTKVSDKMTYANGADPDQTVPEGSV